MQKYIYKYIYISICTEAFTNQEELCVDRCKATKALLVLRLSAVLKPPPFFARLLLHLLLRSLLRLQLPLLL